MILQRRTFDGDKIETGTATAGTADGVAVGVGGLGAVAISAGRCS